MGHFRVLLAFLFLVVIGVTNAENCLGCPQTVDTNNSDARNILTKAVTIQNAKSNEEGINVVSVDKITHQVVSGVKYTFDYVAEGQRSKKRYNCHSVILDQPWVNPEPQILEHKCS